MYEKIKGNFLIKIFFIYTTGEIHNKQGTFYMAVGAKDKIDRELVKKYAKLKMDNPETTKLVDSQKMLSAMNDYAMMQRQMLEMNNRLKDICTDVTSKSVVYLKLNFNPPRARRR